MGFLPGQSMRAPFNVIVFPYRREPFLQFLLGKRADTPIWQAIAGGGEDQETPQQAALRELREETGLESKHLIELDARTTVPRTHFAGHEAWHEHPYVITEFAFAAEVNGEPRRSFEHEALQWCNYIEATGRLRYDSNRTALWELNLRLGSHP